MIIVSHIVCNGHCPQRWRYTEAMERGEKTGQKHGRNAFIELKLVGRLYGMRFFITLDDQFLYFMRKFNKSIIGSNKWLHLKQRQKKCDEMQREATSPFNCTDKTHSHKNLIHTQFNTCQL